MGKHHVWDLKQGDRAAQSADPLEGSEQSAQSAQPGAIGGLPNAKYTSLDLNSRTHLSVDPS